MQFNFNINDLVKDPIEIIDSNTKLASLPLGVNINQLCSVQNPQKLGYAIDEMGKASYIAQNIPQPITTTSKLKYSDHKLYILKDSEDNGGLGSLVGILKVGYKNLFLYDLQNQQNEMKPLCILDFYVHESKQRQGYGWKLFDFMLRHERVEPHHLAVDRPSPKFLSFLAKHFGLTDKIAQVNNYVIFTSFFRDRMDIKNGHNARRTPYTLNPILKKENSFLNREPSPYNTSKITPYRSQSSSRLKTRSTNPENVPLKMDLPACDTLLNTKPLQPIEPLLPRNMSSDSIKWYHNPSSTNYHNYNNNSRHSVVPQILSKPPITNQNIHSQLPHVNSAGDIHQRNKKNYNFSSDQSNTDVSNQFLHSQPLINHYQVQLVHQMRDRVHNPYSYNTGLARHYSHTRLW